MTLTNDRIIESVNLETDEALLTGESLPVAKASHGTFDKDVGAGDRLNIAFSSSTVTKGRAKGVVISTVSFFSSSLSACLADLYNRE